eukprot:6193789-Pleurochrysis_carterae.AAC.1
MSAWSHEAQRHGMTEVQRHGMTEVQRHGPFCRGTFQPLRKDSVQQAMRVFPRLEGQRREK